MGFLNKYQRQTELETVIATFDALSLYTSLYT